MSHRQPVARAARPRLVTVQVGANGAGASDRGDWLAKCLDTITAEAAAWGGRVLVIDYPISSWFVPDWKRDLKALAPPGTLLDPGLRWWEVNGDHLHPTDAGHRRIAEAVRNALKTTGTPSTSR